jgi:hypothetical protein
VLSNLFFASRLCRVEKMTTLFLKPLGAAALSIGVALALYLPLSNHFGVTTLLTVSCILLSCFLYLLFSCLLGVLEAEDLRAMPMGEKILDALIKLHLIQHD